MGDSKFFISDYFQNLSDYLQSYSNQEIEDSLLQYLINVKKVCSSLLNNELKERIKRSNDIIVNILLKHNFPTSLEVVIEFFEFLTDRKLKNENGMVFTPKYISDFIVQDSLGDIKKYDKDIKIIDPACGCGIFLFSVIEYLHRRFDINIPSIIENNIYGVDIIDDNISRCKLVLSLLCLYNGCPCFNDNNHIKTGDSLNIENPVSFDVDSFDFIVGNPPYVNTHDMAEETIQYLKMHYSTTQKGVFNIFYAFIEQSLKKLNKAGNIEFIVPNNFLTIKSAESLRILLKENHHVIKIIDFADNMVFKPVRTYNCIIKLSRSNELVPFEYCVLPLVDDIREALRMIKYNTYLEDDLDNNGWKLVDDVTLSNLRKIENQSIELKDSIRTGIATLKDNIYLVSYDGKQFFKEINGARYEINSGLVKPIYKIPELKKCENPEDVKQYIIFPYSKTSNGYVPIDEQSFMNQYPETYKYLSDMRKELDSRDKGKKPVVPWYAFGRTQGLNKYGKKLMFPTFSDHPKFFFIENEDALFCNGYAVFENPYFDLSLIAKVLNSFVMQYYIQNTSYAIEGGFYCYQKKYIERFSLPIFSKEEKAVLQSGTKEEIDNMLISAYNLHL